MPRKNHRNRKRLTEAPQALRNTGPALVTKSGRQWFVREIPAQRAQKIYRCPGCDNDISPGQAHLVVWAADDFFGDESAIQGRRHWHSHCWRIA